MTFWCPTINKVHDTWVGIGLRCSLVSNKQAKTSIAFPWKTEMILYYKNKLKQIQDNFTFGPVLVQVFTNWSISGVKILSTPFKF